MDASGSRSRARPVLVLAAAAALSLLACSGGEDESSSGFVDPQMQLAERTAAAERAADRAADREERRRRDCDPDHSREMTDGLDVHVDESGHGTVGPRWYELSLERKRQVTRHLALCSSERGVIHLTGKDGRKVATNDETGERFHEY